jgi:hypothetical protein
VRSKTFEERVADGEAYTRPGAAPVQKRCTLGELLDDLVRDEPSIRCANCGSPGWVVDAAAMQARCLACGSSMQLWPEIPEEPPDQDDAA